MADNIKPFRIWSLHLATKSFSDMFTVAFCFIMSALFIKDTRLVYPSDIQTHIILLSATLLVAVYLATKLLSRMQEAIVVSVADISALSLLIWIILGSIFQKPASMRCYYVIGTIFAYLVIKQFFVVRINKLETVSTGILLIGLTQVIIASLQLFDIIQTQGLYKLVGGFDNPGPLAICTSSILVFSTGLYYKIEAPKLKKISFITSLACVLVLPASDSRAAWLGLIAGGFFLMTTQSAWYRFKTSSLFKPVVIGITAMFVVLSVVLWKHKENSGLGRLLIWRVSYDLILDHPITGTGLGNFRYQYPHYQAEYFATKSTDLVSKEILLSDMVEYAFCDIIQFAAEMGIVGAIFFLLFLAILIFFPSNSNPYAISARAAIISITTAGLVSYPLQLASMWWLFLVYALIVSCCLTHTNRVILKRRLLSRIIILAVFVLPLGQLIHRVIGDFEAKRKWYKAQEAFQGGKLSLAEDYFKDVIAAMPYDKEPLLFYGKILMLVQRNKEAEDVFRSATNYIADPFLYCNLGDVSARLGNYTSAEHSYKIASMMTPNRMYPKYLLALHYRRIGNGVKADSMANYIIKMPVKVQSEATEEMRTEMLRHIREANN